MGLIISSCSQWIRKEKIQTIYPNRQRIEKEFHSFLSCSGKGQIISSNPLKGKLYFTFSSDRDSSQVYIKDFLGRRFFSVKGNDKQIFITNHQDNIVHDFNNLVKKYSLNEVITPAILQKYLWGEVPNPIPIENEKSGLNNLNGSINFLSKKSKEDGLIDIVSINFNGSEIELYIEILNREFFETPQFIHTELNN